MGCASSTPDTKAGARTPNAYAAEAEAAAAPSFVRRPEHVLVLPETYGVFTADEIMEVQFLEEDFAFRSVGGSECDEPGEFSRAMLHTRLTVVSCLRHGINGDPEQFAPEEESARTLRRSTVAVRDWLPTVMDPLEATPTPPTGAARTNCAHRPRQPLVSSCSELPLTTAQEMTTTVVDDDGGPHCPSLTGHASIGSASCSGMYVTLHMTTTHGELSSSHLSPPCARPGGGGSRPLAHHDETAPPGWVAGDDGPRFGDSPVMGARRLVTEAALTKHLALLRSPTATASSEQC